MPSTDTEQSRAVRAVVEEYLRRERPLTAVVVLLAVAVFIGIYLVTSLFPATVVGIGLIITARAPLLQSEGTIQLRTNKDREAVINEFACPTPPVLALQWGVADEVTTDDRVAKYTVSYLFGLRSLKMTVDTQTDTTPDDDRLVKSTVRVDDQPWATYRSTVSDPGGDTVVKVAYTSNRRFGLRRVPQQLLAHRYRDDVLTVQGYSVAERDTHLGI